MGFQILVLVKKNTSINLACTWVKEKAQKKIWDQRLY